MTLVAVHMSNLKFLQAQTIKDLIVWELNMHRNIYVTHTYTHGIIMTKKEDEFGFVQYYFIFLKFLFKF